MIKKLWCYLFGHHTHFLIGRTTNDGILEIVCPRCWKVLSTTKTDKIPFMFK